ncbi:MULTISPECIES: hypothetical protein [unclassified Aureispira]|uniref:hypothetical protein n=1 Tax=unclassified Aureispira TaxID=2649989 RepID=UPI0006972AAE|nr:MULTISPECIES: hypothetical protein [unclassified Aureispira]WMX15958.1 hypothetical protein QP953_06225 [Aureispira sp. CCB-E]
MNATTFYENIFELSPQYPLTVLEFLKTELQLGKKYVVMDVHTHNGQLSKLLHKHVHLVCSVSSDPQYHVYLKDKLRDKTNFLSLNALPILTNIEEDSIDCLCIDETFNKYDALRMGIEFERILRLNSYVLVLQNKLLGIPKTFTNAYLTFLKHYHNEEGILAKLPDKNRLEEFYSNGFAQQKFKNQQWLDWSMLKQYYQMTLEKEQLEMPPKALEELEQLFRQFEQEGQVHLEYQTYLYYGLFNHSVPEISLRKSIFFNVLRPFAFVFYILVKANIYFWRALYKIKEKLFPTSDSTQR